MLNRLKMSEEKKYKCSRPSCFYGLGFFGSAAYYISTAAGFWMGALGVLKAMVWPAFLVFEAFSKLGA